MANFIRYDGGKEERKNLENIMRDEREREKGKQLRNTIMKHVAHCFFLLPQTSTVCVYFFFIWHNKIIFMLIFSLSLTLYTSYICHYDDDDDEFI